LENVAHELDCIIKSGYYIFHLGDSKQGISKGEMLLEYELSIPSSPSQTTAEGSQEEQGDTSMLRREKKNSEQIGDFVRK